MASTYNPMLAQIGNRIVKRREELGMSATELAIQSDMSMSALSLIETGQRNPGADKLHNIALALKIPLSYIQPEDLDSFSDIPLDLLPVVEKLKSLSPEKRRMMVTMFMAQMDSLK